MSPRTASIRAFATGAIVVSTFFAANWNASAAESDNPFKEVEADTDRWIQLQSQIATATNDWKSEKILLEGTIKLLEAEQATLEQNLESNRKASSLYTANRDRLAASVADHQEGLASLGEPLQRIEESIRSLLPKLPEPLQQEVTAHLSKLRVSDDGEPASAPARVQSLVAALTAIDRFGNSLTSARVTRPAPDSGEVSVRVLYWGLAIGYGIDQANGRAWVIEPGEDGWVWEERSGVYDRIAALIASYENEGGDPQLTLMPARVN